MKKVKQPGFFDIAERTNKLTEMGDPLVGLNARIGWEAFRPDLDRIYEKERKSNAGAKPIDVVLMFKVLVLQQLNNLSDDRIEYQIRDRLSFMRFLGLELEDRVPDAKTVWLFREQLKGLNLVEELFARFHEQLAGHGYVARRVRTRGLLRAKVKIGMMNLVYNMMRLVQLLERDASPNNSWPGTRMTG